MDKSHEPDREAQTVALLRLLSEMAAYYSHTIADFEAAMWNMVVEEFGPAAVRRALMDYAAGAERFMPKVGQIRERLGASDQVGALRAFEALRTAVQCVGPWASPNLDACSADAVRALGGWPLLCQTMPAPEADRFAYEALFKRFEVAYLASRNRAMAQGALSNAAPATLKGLHALSIEGHGVAAAALSWNSAAEQGVVDAECAPLLPQEGGA